MQQYVGPGGLLASPERLVNKVDVLRAAQGFVYNSNKTKPASALAEIKASLEHRAVLKNASLKNAQKSAVTAVTIDNLVDIAPYSDWWDETSLKFITALHELYPIVKAESGIAGTIIKTSLRPLPPVRTTNTGQTQLIPFWIRNSVPWRRVASHGYGHFVEGALASAAFEMMYINKQSRSIFKECAGARRICNKLTDILDPYGGKRMNRRTPSGAMEVYWVWPDTAILGSITRCTTEDTTWKSAGVRSVQLALQRQSARATVSRTVDGFLRSIYRSQATCGYDLEHNKVTPGSISKDVNDMLVLFVRVGHCLLNLLGDLRSFTRL